MNHAGHDTRHDPDRRFHPYHRTRDDDLRLLADGNETGWYDDTGTPAPWPDNFLHPDSGWAPATTPADPENPPF